MGVRQPQDLNAIVFEHVSLAFDDHVVLKDLSFTVPKGDMRILFGASGAGKFAGKVAAASPTSNDKGNH